MSDQEPTDSFVEARVSINALNGLTPGTEEYDDAVSEVADNLLRQPADSLDKSMALIQRQHRLGTAVKMAGFIMDKFDSEVETFTHHLIKAGLYLSDTDNIAEDEAAATATLNEILNRWFYIEDKDREPPEQVISPPPTEKYYVPAPFEDGKSLQDRIKEHEDNFREDLSSARTEIDFWSRVTNGNYGKFARSARKILQSDHPITGGDLETFDAELQRALGVADYENKLYTSAIVVRDELVIRALKNLSDRPPFSVLGSSVEKTQELMEQAGPDKYLEESARKASLILKALENGTITSPSARVYASYLHDGLLMRNSIIARRANHLDYLASNPPKFANSEVQESWDDLYYRDK